MSPQMLSAENSLFHAIGQIFHPIFVAVAYVLAAIYSVIPNYAIAITLLTVIIMVLLTPLTVKSTKSMLAMQQIQPEIKKLQQKYKGAENRAQLNEEMMRLYRERGVNPAGGCLPMFLQMPFLIVLYDVIQGLANTIAHGAVYPVGTVLLNGSVTTAGQKCMETVCAVPRYIPSTSRMYTDLLQSHGVMESFGINWALKPFSHQDAWYHYIPYFALVLIAVVLQYFQMAQMNKRNTAAAQANRQMQMMQKVMPIFFAYIYFIIPAAVVIYMVISTLIRILTQDIIFRTGLVPAPGERELPAGGEAASRRGKGIINAASSLLEERGKGRGTGEDRPTERPNGRELEAGGGGTPKPGAGAGAGAGAAPKPGAAAAPKPGAAAKANGRGGGAARSASGPKGARGGPTKGSTSAESGAKPHPRSKSKRTRRTR